jgi:hypothetical protein
MAIPNQSKDHFFVGAPLAGAPVHSFSSRGEKTFLKNIKSFFQVDRSFYFDLKMPSVIPIVIILDILSGGCEVMWENVVNSGRRLGVSRSCT